MNSPSHVVPMAAVDALSSNSRFKSKWSIACWILFLAGLVIQLAAPRLKIEHDKFVIPSSMMSSTRPVSPAQIVARERWMQLLSAVLTTGGALGLGACHRPGFLRSRAGECGPPPGKRISGRRRDAVA